MCRKKSKIHTWATLVFIQFIQFTRAISFFVCLFKGALLMSRALLLSKMDEPIGNGTEVAMAKGFSGGKQHSVAQFMQKEPGFDI